MPERRITSDDIAREILGVAGIIRRKTNVTSPTTVGSSGGGGGPAVGMTNPMTTPGDIITGGASGAARRLGIGTDGQVLTVQPDGTIDWSDATGGGGSDFWDYKQSGTPSSPIEGDVWVDTSATPHLLKVYESGAWTQIGASVNTEDIQDAVGTFVTAASPLTATYNDALNTFVLALTGSDVALNWNLDEGGVPTVGLKAILYVPFDADISDWKLLSDTAGDISIDVQGSDYSAYPTFTSLVGAGTKPSLSTAQKATMSSLTSWTTSVTAGDLIAIYVESAADLAFVHFSLILERV